MADVVFTHAKVSTKSDTADATLIQPSDWNDGHALSGGTKGDVVLRDTTAADGASYLASVVAGQVLTSKGAGVLPAYDNPVNLTQSFRGLHLRTHPDNDKAANRVALLGLDEVVMSDGTRYSGLTLPLTADITASGAAGLDTGSRTASTWYEAWLIGKSSTKAVSDLRLILHRAKGWYLDASMTTTNAGAGWLRYNTDYQKIAQSVTAGTSGICPFFDWNVKKVGTPTGNIWITVEADAAGVPSGTPLATSDYLNVANVATSNQWIRFIFRTPASITASTTYWFVLHGDFTISTSNCLQPYMDSGQYAGGIGRMWNGSIWDTAGAYDFMFKFYVTRNDTALTYPAGYDESARLGFVYNSSGNVLVPFISHDRTVIQQLAGPSGTSTNTIGTLIDFSAFLPPVPVVVNLKGANSAADYLTAAGVPDGYGAGANPNHRVQGLAAQVYVPVATSSIPNAPLSDILTDFQAIYGAGNGNTWQLWLDSYRW